MFEPKRQHPVASITNVLRTLRELLVPIIIVVVLGGGSNSRLLDPATMALLVGLLGVTGVLNWMRFYYWIEGDELRITHGIFVKKKIFIPKERIQVIDISSGLVQRIFGLVQVQVQTAGSSSSEARLSAVTLQEAKRLKELLLKDSESAVEEGEEQKREVFSRLSTSRLLLAASTASSFGVAFSIVGYVFSQLDQFIDDDVIAGYIEGAVTQTTAGTWVLILGAAFVFAWLLSVFGTLLRYARFSVRKRKDELVISRGLIERKNITVPFNRIQAVRIVEGIFRQPLGYASIYVESAGYGDEKGESTALMPLIATKEIPDFLSELIPEFSEPEGDFFKPPTRSFPRFLIRLWVPLSLILLAVYFFIWEYAPIALLFFPAILLAYLRYKDAGAKIVDEHIVLQFRNLARTKAITKKHRIQSASSSSNWFQRRKKLESFTATVASGKGGRSFQAENLEIAESRSLLGWVKP